MRGLDTIPTLIWEHTMASVTKNDLVNHIAETAGIKKVQAELALSAVTDGIRGALAKGDKVTLVGFGTFQISDRAARKGRKPSDQRAHRHSCFPQRALQGRQGPQGCSERIGRGWPNKSYGEHDSPKFCPTLKSSEQGLQKRIKPPLRKTRAA